MQRGDLVAGLHPQLGVEIGQWLVHQEHLRAAHDRAAHRHPLALSAGQILGLAVQIGLEVEHLCDVAHAVADRGPWGPADLQRERQILRDGHVRVQRVVLEDHRDVAVLRIGVGDVVFADVDPPGIDRLQPGHHPQRRRLAAARRPHQDQEFAIVDGQIQVIHRRPGRPRIPARRPLEAHRCHGYRPPNPVTAMPRSNARWATA